MGLGLGRQNPISLNPLPSLSIDHFVSNGYDIDTHMENQRKDKYGRRSKGKPQVTSVGEKKIKEIK